MRKLGMERLKDIEEMTLTEFHYKRYAQEYKEIDEEYRMHKVAYLTRNASLKVNKGTEQKPREEYQFQDFKEFFDYDKELKKLDGEIPVDNKEPDKKSNRKLSPAQLAAQHNSRKR